MLSTTTPGLRFRNGRRELASLRVLGFTRGEVLRILLLELAILTLIAQPPGWAMGYGLGGS
ncbi:FtsX-like permease family protein [Bradyrhizobium elkanii]|uniref:FtsX-like permease family protein n=1 Tax=Bradyrhizobium elkanii TaxID=29448 RepID=UPI003F736E62